MNKIKYDIVCTRCHNTLERLIMGGTVLSKKEVIKEIKDYGWCLLFCREVCHTYQKVTMEKIDLTPLIKKKGFYITCDWYSDSGGEWLVEELKLAGFESKYKYENWNERDEEFDNGYIYYPNVKEADEIVCGVTGADYMSDFKDWEYKTKDEINKETK